MNLNEKMIKFHSNPEVQEEVEVLVAEREENKLVLFNDHVNTFDFVIDSLIEICGHDVIQAENCTLQIHLKGKCQVKSGDYTKIEPMCTAMLDRGITAEIQ